MTDCCGVRGIMCFWTRYNKEISNLWRANRKLYMTYWLVFCNSISPRLYYYCFLLKFAAKRLQLFENCGRKIKDTEQKNYVCLGHKLSLAAAMDVALK